MMSERSCGTCGVPVLGEGPCPRCVMGAVIELANSLRPGARVGAYEVDDTLGQGGMGTVYRARHVDLHRTVALKVLSRSFASDREFVERFRREAQALATLSHPNIVQVYDFGVAGDLPYLAMEYVEGVSLRRLLSERHLPPEEALLIVPQLCDALEYAHGMGIVHRDIKPENILIGRGGSVKIADFGIAKILSRGEGGLSTLTGTDMMIGTPNYMAPEQRENSRSVDHRADIFSMGVVFYEMLTGELPLGRFHPPSRKVGVSQRLDGIVLKALEKEPAERYQRAREVKEDLTHVHEPVASSRPRRRSPALLVGCLLVLVVGGGIALGAVVVLYVGAEAVPAPRKAPAEPAPAPAVPEAQPQLDFDRLDADLREDLKKGEFKHYGSLDGRKRRILAADPSLASKLEPLERQYVEAAEGAAVKWFARHEDELAALEKGGRNAELLAALATFPQDLRPSATWRGLHTRALAAAEPDIVAAYRVAAARGVAHRGPVKVALKSPGRECFDFTYAVSTLFTQEEWDKYFRHVVVDTAAAVANTRAGITEADARRRLTELYASQQAEEWGRFLEGTKLREPQSLNDAVDRLELYSGDTSPFHELLASVRTFRELRVSDTEFLNRSSDDLGWTRDVLVAWRKVRSAVHIMLLTTKVDERVLPYMRQDKLAVLLAECVVAKSAVEQALMSCDAAQRPMARRAMEQVVDQTVSALRLQASLEANRLWSAVHKTWVSEARGRFPFVVDAADEVPLATFSRLFNPRSGEVWVLFADLDRLYREYLIDNKPILALSPEMVAAMERARSYRDHLFAKDGESMTLRFRISFPERKDIRDQKLSLGSATYSMFDEPPPHRFEVKWKEGDPLVCTFAIKGQDGEKWLERSYSDKPWGLIRLVGAADPRRKEGDVYRLHLEFTDSGTFGTKMLDTDPTVEIEGGVFDESFFKGFDFPERVDGDAARKK